MKIGELKEILFPPGLTMPGENLLELNEFTVVLQTDLGLPVTKPEQQLLLEEYGIPHDRERNGTMIDVQRILADAGLWDENEHENDEDRPPSYESLHSPGNYFEREKTRTTNRGSERGGRGGGREEYEEEEEHHHRRGKERKEFSSPTNRLEAEEREQEEEDSLQFSPVRSPQGGKLFETMDRRRKEGGKKEERILSATENTLSELKDLHSMIEEEFDDRPRHSSSSFSSSGVDRSADKLIDELHETQVTATKHPRKEPKQWTEKENEMTSSSASLKKNKEENEKKPIGIAEEEEKQKKTIPKEFLENETIKQLVDENEKLKNEVSAFDSNFFEELEDLKFRYSRLHEAVGEDPFLDDSLTRSLQTRHDRRNLAGEKMVSLGALPLNKLSWATKNAMKAIDHASYSSPLVRGRRGTGSRGGGDHSAHSRSLSPLRGGGRGRGRDDSDHYNHFDDSHLIKRREGRDSLLFPTRTGRTGSSLSPSRSSSASVFFDGGIHGIGEGKYSLQSSGGFDELGGGSGEGGSFANLCERRLVFELSSHPKPTEITALLIHK
jgi:hypothetical protein